MGVFSWKQIQLTSATPAPFFSRDKSLDIDTTKSSSSTVAPEGSGFFSSFFSFEATTFFLFFCEKNVSERNNMSVEWMSVFVPRYSKCTLHRQYSSSELAACASQLWRKKEELRRTSSSAGKLITMHRLRGYETCVSAVRDSSSSETRRSSRRTWMEQYYENAPILR